MTVRSFVRLLVLVVIATAPEAAAEGEREALRARARTFLVLRLTEALALDDADALAVGRVLEQAEERRDRLEAARRGVEGEIRDALSGGEAASGRLGGLVDRAAELDEEMALVPAQTFRELRALLTVEQQAKLALARPKIHEEIRGAMHHRLERRRTPKAPPPPP